MGLFAAGQVVVLPFPYSDLTQTKLRPVLLLASAGREDWIACQITTNPVSGLFAVELNPANFASGGLRYKSYARPEKLSTLHESLIVTHVGTLTLTTFHAVRDAVIAVIRPI